MLLGPVCSNEYVTGEFAIASNVLTHPGERNVDDPHAFGGVAFALTASMLFDDSAPASSAQFRT